MTTLEQTNVWGRLTKEQIDVDRADAVMKLCAAIESLGGVAGTTVSETRELIHRKIAEILA